MEYKFLIRDLRNTSCIATDSIEPQEDTRGDRSQYGYCKCPSNPKITSPPDHDSSPLRAHPPGLPSQNWLTSPPGTSSGQSGGLSPGPLNFGLAPEKIIWEKNRYLSGYPLLI